MASGGVAILLEAMTDNRNRTVAEVRHAFSKHGGNLGTDGSVAYLFHQAGHHQLSPPARMKKRSWKQRSKPGLKTSIAEEDGAHVRDHFLGEA